MNKEIGGLLKKKREEKGLSIDDAYKATKIQPSTLHYLEEGIAKDRLGPVYAKSFLKIYAKFLGLDPNSLVKEEGQNIVKSQPIEEKKVVASKVPVLEKNNFSFPDIKLPSMNKLKVIIIPVLVLLLVFVVSLKIKHSIKNIKPDQISKKIIHSEQKAASKIVPKTTPKASKKLPKIPASIPDKLSLLIRAKEDSWLQVKCDSKVVFQRMLAKGSVEKWEAKDKINLWVGNAAGLVVELNGQNIGPLGRRSQVIKNIVITKQGVTIGK